MGCGGQNGIPKDVHVESPKLRIMLPYVAEGTWGGMILGYRVSPLSSSRPHRGRQGGQGRGQGGDVMTEAEVTGRFEDVMLLA